MLKKHLASIRHDFQQNKTFKCKRASVMLKVWKCQKDWGDQETVSHELGGPRVHPMEVKMPNATGEGMQSLSTLVVSSIFPSGLLNTVNLGHLYYLTLSVIGGQGVKRWIRWAGNCVNPLPKHALFFPIVVSTCLVLCGNNLCVWQRKKRQQ